MKTPETSTSKVESDVYKQHKIWSTTQDETHIIEYIYSETSNNQIITLLEQYVLDHLHDGPTFFNFYPNFAMNLKNDKTSNAIKLYVKLLEDIVDEMSDPIMIIFRIYYKVTKIDYKFKALTSSKEEKILVEVNLRKSLVQTPTRLSHHEVINTIHEEWYKNKKFTILRNYYTNSEIIRIYKKISNKIKEEQQLQRFLGYINYIVEFISNIRTICAPLYKRLKKNPPIWLEEMTNIVKEVKTLEKSLSCLGILDPRASLILETHALELGHGTLYQSQQYFQKKLMRFILTSGKFCPSIQKKSKLPKYSPTNYSSTNYSPTKLHVLNTSSTSTREKPFEIDKKWIRKDFEAKCNSDRREWFFNTFSKEQTEKFREKYYKFMYKNKINVYFFDWFSQYCDKKEIEYLFHKQKEISTIGVIDNNWKTKDNEIIRSEYPPQQDIKLQLSNNLEIEGCPYKDIRQNLDKSSDKSDIKKAYSQLNYSNIVLEDISKQLGKIENSKQLDQLSSSSIITKPPVKPIYKLINTSQKELESIRFDSNTNLKIEEIRKKLEKLSIEKSSSNTLELVGNKLTGYPKLKNYYPESSLVDVQYEERGELIQNSFSKNEISTCNLDGMSEQTILNSARSETNQEDDVATIIFKNKIANQLINLYCPTMSDYKWYKDTFLSIVTLREDGSAKFWKEKFIVGLPRLFSEKVKMNLERHYGNPINYDSLTYGQLHNILVKTGIEICIDFKLQNKMKKKSVSIFCHQYGVEPIVAPSARQKKKIKTRKRIESNINYCFISFFISLEEENEDIRNRFV
ncbi:hypothetical protein CR513_31957, partial [Mucuna pruriens]